MTSIDQQLEKEVFELMGNGSSENSMVAIYALEAACLILDNKFGKDFHKKNPKLAVRFSEAIMKNIQTSHLSSAIINEVGEYLGDIKNAIANSYFKGKETMFEDYSDSFRF